MIDMMISFSAKYPGAISGGIPWMYQKSQIIGVKTYL
jgi:hypothetical protein